MTASEEDYFGVALSSFYTGSRSSWKMTSLHEEANHAVSMRNYDVLEVTRERWNHADSVPIFIRLRSSLLQIRSTSFNRSAGGSAIW